MKESQIIGLVAGFLLTAGYIALHMIDVRRRAKTAESGKFQLPFSPMAMFGRFAVLAVVLFVVLKVEQVDKYWFIGTIAAVYTIFFVWELKSQWSKKK